MAIRLKERSVKALGQIITGDEKLSRYRSGPQLVVLFNNYGGDTVYGGGFPSRWVFAEEEIRRINGTKQLASLIAEVLHPREFANTEFDQAAAIEYLNNQLRFDEYEVRLSHGKIVISDIRGATIDCPHPFDGSEDDGHNFIKEQLEKSEQKILDGDYDGAITNARSLTEAVLLEIEQQLESSPPEHDGDLIRLYKRVQRLLKLDPARPDIDASLKQVLTGLSSIVNGLAATSNRMGDRHARSYKPSKHHAVLVVNAARTLVSFLFETTQFQLSKGSLAKTGS